MSAIMKSISPKECERIANGEQTVLVSKTSPKIETPFKCYIYCSYGNDRENYMLGKRGKVIGEFECDRIYEIKNLGSSFMIGNDIALTNRIARESCLDYDDMISYLGNKDGYGWHISDLKIYDEPKELSKFERPCSYKGTCYYCARAKFESDGTRLCDNKITRPPKSWCYVEEL